MSGSHQHEHLNSTFPRNQRHPVREPLNRSYAFSSDGSADARGHRHYIGKGFNILTDLVGNAYEKARDRSPNSSYVSSGDDSPSSFMGRGQRTDALALECIMARNKEYALNRIRNEEIDAYDRMVGRFDLSSEGRLEHHPGPVAPGKPLDVHRKPICVQSSSMGEQPYGSPVTAHHRTDPNMGHGQDGFPDHYVPYQRVNVPARRRQRASSCPTPVQHSTPAYSVPTQQPVRATEQQPPVVSSTRYPKTSTPIQAFRNTDGFAGTMGSLTTITTAGQQPAPPTPPSLNHRRIYERIPNAPFADRYHRDDHHGMDYPYDRSSPRTAPRTPPRPPGSPDQFLDSNFQHPTSHSTPVTDINQPLSSMGQEAYTTPTHSSVPSKMSAAPSPSRVDPSEESFNLDGLYRSLEQGKSTSPWHPRAPQNTPQSRPYYHNVSRFDDQRCCRRGPAEPPEDTFIDLTDETKNNEGDSSPNSRSHSPISWNVTPGPPAPPTTHESPGAENTIPTTEAMDSAADTNKFMELQQQQQLCEPSPQRNDAGALQHPHEHMCGHLHPPPPQVRDAATHYSDSLHRVERPEDTTMGLRSLFAKQTMDKTNCDLNTFFGTQTQPMIVTDSVRECFDTKRCDQPPFASADNTVQDPDHGSLRKAEIENLVKDNYCPGIIQDAVDGRHDFNKYAYNITFSKDPQEICADRPPTVEPITLLEAFSLRIDKERAALKKDLRENETEEKIAEIVHKHFINHNPTDLNRCIKCYLLAENLLDREQADTAKDNLLEAEVQRWNTNWPNSEVKLMAYTGRAKTHKKETA